MKHQKSRTKTQPHFAVAVMGRRNFTRITPAYPMNDALLDSFAARVAKSSPKATYYIVEVDLITHGRRWKYPVYRWHVGEGFEHKEGWWITVEN